MVVVKKESAERKFKGPYKQASIQTRPVPCEDKSNKKISGVGQGEQGGVLTSVSDLQLPNRSSFNLESQHNPERELKPDKSANSVLLDWSTVAEGRAPATRWRQH